MNYHKTSVVDSVDLPSRVESKNGLVTIFTIPKAFSGHTNLIQRNAIKSWANLGAEVSVVLVGDEHLISETANELGVHHQPSIRRNKLGTPLVCSAFESVRNFSDSPILVYCNSDVILMPDFLAAIKILNNSPSIAPFVAIGRRTDLHVNGEIDFACKKTIQCFLEDVKSNGQPAAIVCKEFFAFSRDLFSTMPGFAVGRGNWDNWMVTTARIQNVPVVDIAPVTTVIHQSHGYEHLGGGRLKCYVTGVEARQNQELAGGRNLVRGSSSTWVLTDRGLRRKKLSWANLDFWRDSVLFMRLMLNLLISRQ